MKDIVTLLFIFLFTGNFYSQTHTRKTRSDKGKTHCHTTSYVVKKALKPKSTKTTTTKK